jgi:hypothetical protein
MMAGGGAWRKQEYIMTLLLYLHIYMIMLAQSLSHMLMLALKHVTKYEDIGKKY